MTETGDAILHRTARAVLPEVHERDVAVRALFVDQRLPMTRLAVLLGADDGEDVVAESFYQLYRRWPRLRDSEAARAYLRATVINLTRMRIRHLQVTRRHADRPDGASREVHSSEAEAVLRDDQKAVVRALGELPQRQREALVLRYWLDLREKEIAETMGISAGAVKTHVSRGMAALSRLLEEHR